MNPFDLRGPEFLVFYFILSTVVIVALVLFRRVSESASAPKIDLGDPYLIAYLRGGENEALCVALVSLIDRGLLIADGTHIERAPNAGPHSVRRPVEKAMMETYSRLSDVTAIFNNPSLKSACAQYEETLKQNRLLADESVTQARLGRFTVGLVILGVVAGLKIFIALERGRTNITFLVFFAIMAIVIAGKVSFPRLTASGKALLADVRNLYSGLKDRASFIRPGGATIEPMMLAAAFGVGALAGEGFAYTKKLFPRARRSSSGYFDSSSSGSSCSSSCGSSSGSSCGGGCGGGGCGGCGS